MRLLVTASAIRGLPVVTIESGEDVAEVRDVIYNPEAGRVVGLTLNKLASLVVGKGRKALLVAREQVIGFGPDAMMVSDENALHPPRDDSEGAAANGKLELVGKRLLSDMGNDLGTVSDVLFDPGDRRHRNPAARRPRGASGVAPGSRLVRRDRVGIASLRRKPRDGAEGASDGGFERRR